MTDVFCSSCKKKATNLSVTRFSCPNCDKSEIIRCTSCRANAVKYVCPKCEFTGPN